jgi:flagellar P-ring protein FlgI
MMRALLVTMMITLAAGAWTASPARAERTVRVGDLTGHEGDTPVRLVGYGLVVGLDGTGDRTFGTAVTPSPTVRSVINLLNRFHVEIPAERLRLRNVAAVLVTAEISPYAKPGRRFEVQVSALGDASSLRGGTLWITPLLTDPDAPPLATAQGSLLQAGGESRKPGERQNNVGRIPEGGLLEVPLPGAPPARPALLLDQPDLLSATRIAAAVNGAFGAGTATVEDPGAVQLHPASQSPDSLAFFLAAVDTIRIAPPQPARIVINAGDGTVVAGGDMRIGPAVISSHGLTLQIGGAAAKESEGLVHMDPDTSVQDVAAGLHASGAQPGEIADILEALRAAGALQAEIVVR